MTRAPAAGGWRAGVPVLLALVLALAAACGGSDGEGVARADDVPGASEGAAPAETTPADRERAMLAFARCMRDQGLDFPDPVPDEDGNLRFRIIRPGADGAVDRERFMQAADDCGLESLRPPLSDEEEAERQDAMLAFARCMRDNGVDVPDPQPGQPPLGRRLDPGDPAVAEALETCRAALGDLPGPVMRGRR